MKILTISNPIKYCSEEPEFLYTENAEKNGRGMSEQSNLRNAIQVHVFLQFFVHSDIMRQREIRFCLHKHVENPDIYKIHLINERIYTSVELGVTSDKIVQTVIGRRLRFPMSRRFAPAQRSAFAVD